jgi:KaiC/GvpD/RAD55 family RecA-like ATPase
MVRIATGVPGLDEVLNGGLISGGVYIVEGAPGCGKTILGNQICFHRAAAGDSTVYITLLAESHTRMIAHLRSLDFFRPELIGKSIYYLSSFKILEESGLDGLLKSIRDTIRDREASFVVLDGLVSAEEFADSPRDFKKFIHELQTVTGMSGCTVLLLSSTERGGSFRPEHTMVDGIIELGDTLAGVQSLRHVLVRKMRGTSQLRGRHAVDITSAGIKIAHASRRRCADQTRTSHLRLPSRVRTSGSQVSTRCSAVVFRAHRVRSSSAPRAAERRCSGFSSWPRASSTSRWASMSGSTSVPEACCRRMCVLASVWRRRTTRNESTSSGKRRSKVCSMQWSIASSARSPSMASRGSASTVSTASVTMPNIPSARAQCSRRSRRS